MSAARVSRRRIAQLQDKVDLILEADARFFDRHRDRNHRLRLAGQAEVEILQEIHATEFRIPPGERLYCVVRQIEPGTRMRNYVPNERELDTDIPEDQAAWLFDHLSPAGSQGARAEACIRQVLAKRRAQ